MHEDNSQAGKGKYLTDQSSLRSGFTLLEILVSLIIIAIGLAAVIAAFFSGKNFLQQAENKAKAMSVASMRMEEQLAQSYAKLENPPISYPKSPDYWQIQGTTCFGPDWLEDKPRLTPESCWSDLRSGGKPFSWTVKVSTLKEGEGKPQIKNPIPYRSIEVMVDYSEEPTGSVAVNKSVYLRNIVAYPQIHLAAQDWGEISPSPIGAEAPYRPAPDSPDSGGLLASFDLPVYSVDKNIEVTYNVVLDVSQPASCPDAGSDTCLEPVDTIWTAGYLFRKPNHLLGRIGPVSRTSIVFQPLFSNMGANPEHTFLGANQEYQLQIWWFKDTAAGRIRLRDGNIIVMAFERY